MNFHIMTLFPEMVEAGLKTSILGRAEKAGLICIKTYNIRDFSKDIHKSVDDYPYGGGAGMVMQAGPIYDCYKHIMEHIPGNGRKMPEDGCKTPEDGSKMLEDGCEGGNFSADGTVPYVIYMSPAGVPFDQNKAKALAGLDDLVILCGHYEGVDQRVIDLIVDEEISIGDYVLTGGELAAMVVTDAVSRMVPGVLTNDESGCDESFSDISPRGEFTKKGRKEVYGSLSSAESIRLLEYPQYTRPEEFMGLKVPEVLLSGHHENIMKWRRKTALEKTRKCRPDLLADGIQ